MFKKLFRHWRVILAAFVLLTLPWPGNGSARAEAAGDPPAQISGPIEIPGTPLRILVGLDGGMQVYHALYYQPVTFGMAGSGFFVTIGSDVYGPGYNPLTLTNQPALTGSGTRSQPYQVVTIHQINGSGAELQLIQTVTYINQDNYFQLDWALTNLGASQTCLQAYHAADLYFADNDYGIGYYHPGSGAVGGYNQARDWYMVFIPLTPADHYEEGYYSTIWGRVAYAETLQDTIDETYIDNGAALQWNACLGGGESRTFSDSWSFGQSEAEALSGGGGSWGGGASGVAFRQPGPLTPQITTYIPTPLDVSYNPAVIGTNLLLAALATIAFTIATESLNRSLAENEAFIEKLFGPLKWLRDQAGKLDLSKRLGRPFWLELIKLAGILLVYGFVFSLLDASWRPFSLTGITLFLTMTAAFGLVGLADDIVQWLAARRWKLGPGLNMRLGSLLLIVASAAFSRGLSLTPGIMFGAPEVFELSSTELQARKKNTLLRLAAATLLLILVGAWLLTVPSALMLRWVTGHVLFMTLVSGVQGFLLLVFAVTVQNLFLQMLNMPGTIGEALRRWSWLAWAFGLLVATFIFLHTLLNPRGDLARALQNTNIRYFFITIGLFLAFTLLVNLFFQVRKAMAPQPVMEAQARWARLQRMGCCLGLLVILLLCMCLAVASVYQVVRAGWLSSL